MNKLLPVILTVVILLGILGGGFVAYKKLFSKPQLPCGTNCVNTGEEDADTPELTLENRPYTTLVPGPSCEYTLNLAGIKNNPASVEYEIVYKNGEGVTQGATGTIKPQGAQTANKKILFGSESSGKRRCDPGVTGGSITLRFRDEDGKLKAKTESKFAQSEDQSSVSVDNLSVNLGKTVKGKVLAMGTMGLPASAPGKVEQGPYGVFTNSTDKLSATVKIMGSGDLYGWDGSSWIKVSSKTPNLSGLILVTP